MIYWNLRQWQAFPVDIQRAIKNAAEESGRFEIALCRAGLDDGTSVKTLAEDFKYEMAVPDPRRHMVSKGMKVSVLSDEQIKAFARVTENVRQKWTERIGSDLVSRARSDMAE